MEVLVRKMKSELDESKEKIRNYETLLQKVTQLAILKMDAIVDLTH